MIELSNVLCSFKVCSIHHRRIERKLYFSFMLRNFAAMNFFAFSKKMLVVTGENWIRFVLALSELNNTLFICFILMFCMQLSFCLLDDDEDVVVILMFSEITASFISSFSNG